MNEDDLGIIGFGEDDLGIIDIPDAPEPKPDSLTRQAGMLVSRGAEAIAGLPGDIQNLLESITGGLVEYATGVDVSPAFEQQRKLGLGAFPSSGDIREVLGEATDYALEPQTEAQELAGNIAGDFAALAIPVKGKIPFARALATSTVANLGAEGAKELGFDEAGQDVTKIGLMLAAGLVGKGRGVKNYIHNLYKQADAAIPEGATVASRGIENSIAEIEKLMAKGIDTPSKSAVRNVMNQMAGKIKDGEVLVEDLMAFNRDINEIAGDPAVLERARKFFSKLRVDVGKSLEGYGAQNADFLKYYKDANQAFAGLKYGDKIKSFVRSSVRSDKFPFAMAALGYESAMHPIAAAKGGVALAGGAAGVYAAEVMRRIATNPALAKHYFGVIKSSLKSNRQGLLRSMSALDKALKKSVEKEPLDVLDLDDEQAPAAPPVGAEQPVSEDRSILGRLFFPIIA